MIYTDLMIIGGGPAGLSAAKTVSDYGVKSILVEKDRKLGGQLVKQTHRFFGSKKEKAGMRGFTIAQNIENEIRKSGSSEIWTDSTVLGLYEDGVVTVLRNGRMEKIKPKKIIAATGAFERYLAFENNDLPGVFGAGAVQTLMNVFGVLPG
ncbi:MAG: FAD-dependent oxidoreductase, partial [Petrotogaceae bacterium]|nr:FAD-dependent oxidoreductase [Petrotogaceae bacterium]